MSNYITIERSSTNDEKAGYPVAVKLRADHAILTIEEAKKALKDLQGAITEAEEAVAVRKAMA